MDPLPQLQAQRPKRPKFIGAFLVMVLGAFTMVCVSLSKAPDRDLDFVREVPSEISQKIVGEKISNLATWPEWHFFLTEAKRVEESGAAAQSQEPSLHSLIRLVIEPRKRKSRRFELLVRVTAYEPGRSVQLLLLKDSKGKLTELFDRMEWKTELLPNPASPNGTLIRGSLHTHTAHWRSRVFGVLAQRIFMNQVFYPDLLALAGIKVPSSANLLGPATRQ